MSEVSKTHAEFIENCKDIFEHQSYVAIDEVALIKFAGELRSSHFIPDWKDYLSAAANDAEYYNFKRAFYEMAMIVAQLGGFIFEDENGVAKKWEQGGSGAKAMVMCFEMIREAHALPFYDVAPEQIEEVLKPLLSGVPYAEERLEFFKEFASAENHNKVEVLIDSVYTDKGYIFDMSFVAELAKIMPLSFGDDPFLKKALLTPLMVAAHAYHHNVAVDINDLLPAADYILSQVLNADHVGILKFSADVQEKLVQYAGFDEDAPEVTAMRVATVLACEKIMEHSGMNAREVDGALWSAGRKLQNARPHMMCYTLRF